MLVGADGDVGELLEETGWLPRQPPRWKGACGAGDDVPEDGEEGPGGHGGKDEG